MPQLGVLPVGLLNPSGMVGQETEALGTKQEQGLVGRAGLAELPRDQRTWGSCEPMAQEEEGAQAGAGGTAPIAVSEQEGATACPLQQDRRVEESPAKSGTENQTPGKTFAKVRLPSNTSWQLRSCLLLRVRAALSLKMPKTCMDGAWSSQG